MDGWIIRLHPANSKNKTARLLLLLGELLAAIQRTAHNRRLDCPFVFHRNGKPLGNYRRAWAKATSMAGTAGILIHDLRRSAIRNLVRSGVPERIAMGHQRASDSLNVRSLQHSLRIGPGRRPRQGSGLSRCSARAAKDRPAQARAVAIYRTITAQSAS
jgi:integrase